MGGVFAKKCPLLAMVANVCKLLASWEQKLQGVCGGFCRVKLLCVCGLSALFASGGKWWLRFGSRV